MKKMKFIWGRLFLLQFFTNITLAIAAIYSTPMYAQLVNGDFESACSGTIVGAFQNYGVPGCVTGSWFVSHGSPDIYNNNVPGNITNFVRLWTSGNNSGEGIYIDCANFTAGNTYRIRCNASSAGSVGLTLTVSLANGLTNFDTPMTMNWTKPTIGISEVVLNTIQPPSGVWTPIDFTFTPASSYAQLWFYATNGIYADPSDIYIDNIQITRVLPCPTNVVYSSFSGTPTYTQVSDYIRASSTSAVTGTSAVTFRAGNYIQLEPDFHAASTGTGSFHAYIAPCEDYEEAIQPCLNNNNTGSIGILSLPKPENSTPDDYQSLIANLSLLTRNGMLANYPNPFTGKTMISYNIHEPATVTLTIVDIVGERVANVVQSVPQLAGTHSIEFDASALPHGIYYMILQTETMTVTKKMVVAP